MGRFKISLPRRASFVDVSKYDPDDCLPYTAENAELLMKNGADFDTWVTETVGDLENFTRDK